MGGAGDTTPEPVLQLRDLRKSFGATEVIRGVSISIPFGERHGLIGPNGAGKSTLINLISGNLAPSGGDILLDGRRITGLTPHALNRRGLARSFQITNIFPRLSVYENLRIAVMGHLGFRFCAFRWLDRVRPVTQSTDQLIDKVRLGTRRHHLAGELSYSEQRSLELGMTLATDPSVILLDEPMAGMSRDEVEHGIELIREVTVGKTLLVVEHDMNVVFSLCDRVSVLVYGELIACDTPHAVRTNRAVQIAYLGEEAVA